MFGSVILDVAIGLCLIYFLFSLIASGITEWLMKLKEKRAEYLREGILGLLQDNHYLMNEFYKHPLVYGLYWESRDDFKKSNKILATPSYIPADIFAKVLIDIISPTKGENTLESLKNNILPLVDKEPMYQIYKQVMGIIGDNLAGENALDKIKEEIEKLRKQNPVLIGAILSAIDKNTHAGQISDINKITKDIETIIDQVSSLYKGAAALVHNAENTLEAAQKNIESWFNDAMDRVSGWYKEHTYLWVLGISTVLVIIANVDTINLATTLYKDKNMRDGVVAAATQTVQMNAASSGAYGITEGSKSVIVKDLEKELGTLNIPIGTAYYAIEWKQIAINASTSNQREANTGDYAGWIALKFIGLLISAFAIAQGAPFWFEMMSRLINIRQSGKIPQSKEEPATREKIIIMPAENINSNTGPVVPPRRDD